jgi:iron complex outermembrane receptor protein
MVYGTVKTGGVPGGYAQAPSTPTYNNIVQPEKLVSYTAGIKNRFFDNRLEINDEVFYYDYDNYQVTALLAVAHTNVLLNVQKTKIYGDQLDLRFLLTSDDQFNVSLGLLSARYTDFVIPGAAPENYSGYDAANAPKATLNMSYNHDWRLSNQGTVTGQVQSSYNSGEWTNFNHTPGNYQTAYTKTNVNLTYYSPSKVWNVGLYGKNLENSWVLGAVGPGFAYLEEPRTFGIRLGVNF